MRGLRFVFVPTLLALVGAPALAQDFSDDFNDNDLGAWRLADDPQDIISIAEDNQRLEFTLAENTTTSTRAGIAGRLWWFDAAQPFRCRVTGHFTPEVLGDGTVGLFIQFANAGSAETATISDGVQFEYNVNSLGPFLAYRHYRNGSIVIQDTLLPDAVDEATAYFQYDGAGTLCASLLGYGVQNDTICLDALFPPVTQGLFPIPTRVLVVIGALSDEHTEPVTPEDAWIDDFIIEEGEINFVPVEDVPDDGGPDDTGTIDANGDGFIDLDDLVFILRNSPGGSAARLTNLLERLGFDSTQFSSKQWSTLMTGLYNHRIAPFLAPPPDSTERSASIATLVSLYVGPTTTPNQPSLPDTGTQDANNDGFVTFADVARVLEARTATKERLNEIFDVIGLMPSDFSNRKLWIRSIRPIYEQVISPEFEEPRTKKDRKRDLRQLFRAY